MERERNKKPVNIVGEGSFGEAESFASSRRAQDMILDVIMDLIYRKSLKKKTDGEIFASRDPFQMKKSCEVGSYHTRKITEIKRCHLSP